MKHGIYGSVKWLRKSIKTRHCRVYYMTHRTSSTKKRNFTGFFPNHLIDVTKSKRSWMKYWQRQFLIIVCARYFWSFFPIKKPAKETWRKASKKTWFSLTSQPFQNVSKGFWCILPKHESHKKTKIIKKINFVVDIAAPSGRL